MIILASGSPRRRELLARAGYTFSKTSADIDESVLPDEKPRDYIRRICLAKAEAVRENVPADSVIITADTSVIDGEKILGKPVDAADAVQMLKQLRGRTHQVMTAFVVLDTATKRIEQDIISTDVVMRDYTDAEIDAYVASGDPMDKAGAYAIQNKAFAPVAEINGCYANVVGLPLCRVIAALEAGGHAAPEKPVCDFPTQCAVHVES